VAGTCACFNLRKAARAVTQVYDAALAESGLKATQFTVLLAASLAEGAPLSRLADILVMDRTTLTRNLRPLEIQGLIQTERGKDRRERLVSLSDKGRHVLDAAMPLWNRAQQTILNGFGTDRWTAILQELAAVVAVAQRPGQVKPP
jgi:DNA-binding MarR family transcriptional regulator